MKASERKRKHRDNLRRRVWVRDGGACQICFGPIIGIKHMTLDHVLPRSKGGRAVFMNLRAAHKKCNEDRGNGDGPGRTPERAPEREHRNPMTVTILDRFEAIRDPWDDDFGLTADNTLIRMNPKRRTQ